MTKYANVTKVFYRPGPSNNYTWKMAEVAVTNDRDTYKTAVVSSTTLKRKGVQQQISKPAKLLKRGGFLGNMRNRVKQIRFTKFLKHG